MSKLTHSQQERFDHYEEKWWGLNPLEREDYNQLLAKRNNTEMTGWDRLSREQSPRV